MQRFAYVAVLAGAGTGLGLAQNAESGPPLGRTNLEFYSGATFGLPGSRALTIVDGQTADSGARKVLGNYGLGANFWLTKHVGLFVDASGIDGGKAYAQVGQYRTDVRSQFTDLHFGVQVQKPGPRFRPYLSIGGGPAWTSVKTTFNFAGTITPDDVHEVGASIVYGGGFRYFFRNSWGARLGYEGVALHSGSGNINYSRTVFGILWQH